VSARTDGRSGRPSCVRPSSPNKVAGASDAPSPGRTENDGRLAPLGSRLAAPRNSVPSHPAAGEPQIRHRRLAVLGCRSQCSSLRALAIPADASAAGARRTTSGSLMRRLGNRSRPSVSS
jgi:hypothetical protein